MNIWNHQFFGWYFGKLMISYTYSFWLNLTFSLFQIILLQFKIAYLEFITKRTSCTGVWRIFQPIHKTVPTENFQSHSLFWLEQFWVIFSNCLPAGIIHLIQLIFIGMIKILPTHLCWVWITKIFELSPKIICPFLYRYYVIKDWANTATPNSFGQPHAVRFILI